MSEPAPSPSNRTQKAAHLAALRKRIAGIETRHVKTVGDKFSFGVGELDAHFGAKGCPFGALHEVTAADHRATPAAWGFLLAVTHRIATARCGPILWPFPRAAKSPFGIPMRRASRHLATIRQISWPCDARTFKNRCGPWKKDYASAPTASLQSLDCVVAAWILLRAADCNWRPENLARRSCCCGPTMMIAQARR